MALAILLRARESSEVILSPCCMLWSRGSVDIRRLHPTRAQGKRAPGGSLLDSFFSPAREGQKPESEVFSPLGNPRTTVWAPAGLGFLSVFAMLLWDSLDPTAATVLAALGHHKPNGSGRGCCSGLIFSNRD